MSEFIDFRDKTLQRFPDADLCIVGAGAAGITIARALAASGMRIVLLESGGLALDGATQSLYRADQDGVPYYDMATCRLRYFGGTTNHWGGYCRENDRIDYEGRPELGVPAWPVNFDEISPYVKQAASNLALPLDEWNPEVQIRRYGLPTTQLIENQSALLVTKVFQLTKRRLFRQLYADELKQQLHLTVVTHANVVKINLDDNATTVRSLTVRALDGYTLELSAKRYVLATHAVENARLLLESDAVLPTGIGNLSGQVGKNFMEHAHLEAGFMIPTAGFSMLYDSGYVPNKHRDVYGTNANLSISEAAMRKEGILQYYCRFRPAYDEIDQDFKQLYDGFWEPLDLTTIAALGRVVGDMPASVRYIGNRLNLIKPRLYKLDHRIEQAPNPGSRIVLENERDALGVRKVRLNWSFNELDLKTFRIGQMLVARELTRLGWGRFVSEPIGNELLQSKVKGHWHHIGTTRMSDDPKQGVVDGNCLVHGTDNLYVAGSSIFPSAGYSGPTMMIVAFALRLAEHLRGHFLS